MALIVLIFVAISLHLLMNSQQVLMCLLFLEVLSLVMIFSLFFTQPFLTLPMSFFLSIFTFAVCEATLGIGVMILSSRETDKSFMKLMSQFSLN